MTCGVRLPWAGVALATLLAVPALAAVAARAPPEAQQTLASTIESTDPDPGATGRFGNEN